MKTFKVLVFQDKKMIKDTKLSINELIGISYYQAVDKNIVYEYVCEEYGPDPSIQFEIVETEAKDIHYYTME